MRSLGHICEGDIVRHLVSVKKRRGKRARSEDIAVRLIGDYVQDGSPVMHSVGSTAESAEDPLTVVIGGTLSYAQEGGPSNRLVLHRSSCEMDTRDHVYVEDLELVARSEVDLVRMLTTEVRGENQVLRSGKKRKRVTERFLGFRFRQRAKPNPRRLHYDTTSASEVIGDIQFFIPTITFIGSSNAVDVAELCTNDRLRSLYSSYYDPEHNPEFKR